MSPQICSYSTPKAQATIEKIYKFNFIKIKSLWEFPGGPVVKTQCFRCSGLGLIPGEGMKILQATQRGQKMNK